MEKAVWSTKQPRFHQKAIIKYYAEQWLKVFLSSEPVYYFFGRQVFLQCLNIFQIAVNLRKLSDRLSKVVLVLSITARDALPSSNIAFTPKAHLSSVLFRRKIFMRYHLLRFMPSTILVDNNNFRLTRNEAFRLICCKCVFGAPMSGPTMTVATWRVIGLAGDKLGTRL